MAENTEMKDFAGHPMMSVFASQSTGKVAAVSVRCIKNATKK